jgi:hypothetical protein
MSSTRPLTCPACGQELQGDAIKGLRFRCPHCENEIRFSGLRWLFIYVLAFGASLLVSHWVGLKAYQAPLWIPTFVLCFVLAAWLAPALGPPLLAAGGHPEKKPGVIQSNLVLFLTWWFVLAVFLLCYGYVITWIAYFLGGSHRDILESADMLSYPLRWINPALAVTPDKGFVAVIAIVSANCYFYALGLTLVFKIVHERLRRNRVTELGLSGKTMDDSDDL